MTIDPKRFLALAALTAAAACSQDASETSTKAAATQDPAPASATPALTATTLGDQALLNNAEHLASEPYASADKTNGQAQAQICKACHSLQQGGPNMIGPALHGFFGRAAGSQAEFAYSAALQEADLVWTPRALDAWLSAPGRFLPGNAMMFPGVMNGDDRTDLIAYLLAATADGSTLTD